MQSAKSIRDTLRAECLPQPASALHMPPTCPPRLAFSITCPEPQSRSLQPLSAGIRVGDEKWEWAFQELVDLAYVWTTQSDQTPASPSSLAASNLTRVITDNSSVAGTGGANTLEYYVTTLNNTLQVWGDAKPSRLRL